MLFKMSRSEKWTNITKLTEGNYLRWKRQVLIILEGSELLDVTNGRAAAPDPSDGTYAAWRKKDLEAQALILSSCDDTNQDTIADAASSKEMWDKLASIHSDTSALNQAETMARFYSYQIKEGESLIVAYQELERLAKEIRNMGENISDKAIIAKIISVLPKKHEALRKAWASVPIDLQTMASLLTRLKQEERERVKEADGKTEAESARAFASQHHGEKKNFQKMSIADRKKITKCAKCGKKGHWAKECRSGTANAGKPSEQSKEGVRAFMARDEKVSNEIWISDSGASAHFCGDLSWLASYTPYDIKKPIQLTTGVTFAHGFGTVEVKALCGKTWDMCYLRDVLYVPGSVNLFSESKCAKYGSVIHRNAKETVFKGPKGESGPIAYFQDGIYVMQFKRSINLSAHFSQAQLWHERCAHVNIEYIRKTVAAGAADGINQSSLVGSFQCEGCVYGKSSRQPHPSVPHKRDLKVGEMFHVDLAGPVPVQSLGGSSYMLLLKDEASTFTTVYFLKNKNSAAVSVIDYVNFIENQTGNKVKSMKSDNGKEFVCSELQNFLSEKGIVHERSAPYTPQSNGKIERHIRTIKDYARSMLNRLDSPQFLWAEAVSATVYVWNRVLNKQCGDKTPFEQVFKRKPNLSHLRVFGCTAYAHINEQFRKVFDSKTKKCKLVGYSGVSQNYRLYDPVRRIIFEARNVIFEESLPEMDNVVKLDFGGDPVSETESEKPATSEASTDTEYIDCESASFNQGENSSAADNRSESDESDASDESVVVEVSTSKGSVVQTVKQNTPTRIKVPSILRNLRDRAKIKTPDRYTSYSTRVINDPSSFQEAITSAEKDQWVAAMEDEMKSLDEQNTWELVTKPTGVKVLGNRWVYRTKLNSDGSVDRHKARLVIKGYHQRYGIDYEETFSSVCRYETIRTVLAMAAEDNMQIKQMDVKTAFLYGELKEDVYMAQPEGFELDSESNLVCKLKKSLYGLKQAPRCWSEKFAAVLKEVGLVQSTSDPCLFFGNVKNDRVFIVVYVDDALVLSKQTDSLQHVIDFVASRFQIKVDEPCTFVGLQINRDAQGNIWLHQEMLVHQILERFNMIDCNPVSIPMCPSIQLKCQESEDEAFPYRSLIGALLFLAKTSRPDIAFAVAKLSQFTNGYGNEHWLAAKKVIRYLKGTADLSLFYQCGNLPTCLNGFCDSDYACDKNDRKSQSGVVFFVNEKLVSWRSQKQRVVACSTTEAEYIALAEATKESLWMHRLLSEMREESVIPVVINMDNTSAIRLANNPEFHQRSKHIDVAYHLAREHVQSGFMKINYVQSSDQLADGLTKPLPGPKHEQMRKAFQMQPKGVKNVVSGVSAMFCALMTLLVIPMPGYSSFTSSSSVLWRPTDVPVVNGYTNVHILVKLEEPCTVFNGTVHPELQDEFYARCMEMYNEYFLNEVTKFCPHKTFTDHEITKRFAITLGILIATVVMTVGVGAVSVGMSYKAASEVSTIADDLEDANMVLEAANRNIALLEDKYLRLKKTVTTVVQRLSVLESDHELLKHSLVDSIFGASFMTGKFLTCQQIMRGTQRAWSRGNVYEPFLDYLNFTMPCGESCPVSLATPKRCSTSRDNSKIHVEFTVPIASTRFQVVDVDPFEIRKVYNSTACKMSYTGPSRLVIEKGTHCVSAVSSRNQNVVLVPSGDCYSKIENITLFTMSECKELKYDNDEDWIQVKRMYNQYYIYCANNNLTIGNWTNKCPETPFVLPLTTTFMINKHKFVGNEMHINHLEADHPAWTVRANWVLQPDEQLQEAMVDLEEDEPLEKLPFYHHHSFPTYTTGGGVAIIIIILAGFLIYRSYKVPRVEVVARPK